MMRMFIRAVRLNDAKVKYLDDAVTLRDGSLGRLVRVEGHEAERPPPPRRTLLGEVHVLNLR